MFDSKLNDGNEFAGMFTVEPAATEALASAEELCFRCKCGHGCGGSGPWTEEKNS